MYGRDDCYSSGQIPLDLVSQGLLNRFGYIDPSDGGRIWLGTASGYFSQNWSIGYTFKLDSYLSLYLFDVY